MNDVRNTQELFADGMSEMVAGNFNRSVDLLTAVIGHEPKNRLALTARGSAHFKLKDYPAAMADFHRAIEADPGHPKGYHLRGLVREITGDDAGALEDFDRAVTLSPEYAAAYYSRATLLAKMGDADRAAEDIQMVTHLTHRNIETFANENNVWRSQHMRLESLMETELAR